MSWLAQNWVWVVAAVAVAWWFWRGGLGGYGHAGAHGGGGGSHDERPDSPGAANSPDAAVDPVSGEAVRAAQALSSVYQGRIYHFASKENRERFEAAPQDYAQKVAGHPVSPAGPVYERPRRRRGC